MKEGYTILPPINRDRYTDLSHEGLEGPYMMKNGKVLYYDPKEGSYYDRDTDMYVSYEDYRAMNEEHSMERMLELAGIINEYREVSEPFLVTSENYEINHLSDRDIGKWAMKINGRISMYPSEEEAKNSRETLIMRGK